MPWFQKMTTAAHGCKFCDILQNNKDVHLKESEHAVVVHDINPKTNYHYLVLSKRHISKPTDLTLADLPLLEEMERLGREVLRRELKNKGEADTIEDMIRLGFHWPPMIRINHLHMHVMYPINKLTFFSKLLTFRPGKVFRTTKEVIDDLKQKAGHRDPLEGNPAKDDKVPDEGLPAHAIAN